MAMKKTIIIFILSFVIGAGCKKDNSNDPEPIDSPVAENYVALLKSNSYDSGNLPALSYTDISTLLKYRNETMVITNFPHNPISSLFAPECKLGMYVLWSIESIRAVEIDSEYLIMRFPSQNPILALRDANELKLVHDNTSHEPDPRMDSRIIQVLVNDNKLK